MKLSKNVIIAAGGSGGHLFPALALADRLKEKGKQVILVISSKKIDKKISNLRDYPREIIYPELNPLRKGGPKAPPFLNNKPRTKTLVRAKHSFPAQGGARFSKGIRFFWRIYLSFLRANRILNKYKPAAVVGLGGKNTIPLLLLSVFKRIPTLIHEQNVLPGRANRFLSKFVNKIAISFSSTERFFPQRKVVLTGNPLRREIFGEGASRESTANFEKPKGDKKDKLLFKDLSVNSQSPDLSHTTSLRDKSLRRFTILIMGGSQGAHRINITTLRTLKELSRSERERINIIHLSGESDYPFLKKEYSGLDIDCSLFPFLENIGRAYAAADLLISRAGATTIAEIIALKKAAVLVPYPYASGHQKANAELLSSKDAALMIEEKDFNPQYLRQIILALENNPERIRKIKKNLEQFAVANADELLAEEVMKLGNRIHPVKSAYGGILPC
ncbi:MAG: UDP-N-acetylglucosamine--N-acetylmuramyl-(pentapeptide) pyrophosphoryl-undecaprenol N-acetylglucosamine transferase [Candidatus Omnitrophica bacterium]|nr:UDP-N-acetylglucosamine--N-acetylmuramyl-(pentapeptide) pyrophosphoryl-undecaprenol N-acetylglucosamine transferase [Candidatus Omnitrophota bacterium]